LATLGFANKELGEYAPFAGGLGDMLATSLGQA